MIDIENNILKCIIEDNGVGRSFAKSSQSKSIEKTKSLGVQITRQRLMIFNGKEEGMPDVLEIEDLCDNQGQATGTKVSLQIKYKEVMDETV